jgi:hypothetical protein
MTDYVYHNTSYNDGKFRIILVVGTVSFIYIKHERNMFRCALRELDRSKKLPHENIYSKLEFDIKTTRRIDKGNHGLPTVIQNEWTVVSCFVGTNEMSLDVQ